MKKYLSLLVMQLCCCLFAFSQDIDKIKTTFDYIRLPLKPLDKEVKNYTSKVVLGYVEKVGMDKASAEKKYSADMEEYNKKVAEAEETYKSDMIEYEKRKKEAEDKYAKEKEEWDKKSTGKKLLEKSFLDESKPKLQLPSHPYKKLPVRPVFTDPESAKIQKIFNTDELASTMLRLDGYPNSKENAVSIVVTMMGFEYKDPPLVDIKETSSYQTSTKSTVKQNFYSYNISYKHPMSMRIETGKGVITDEYIEAFNNYTINKTTAFKTQYELEQWWVKNKDAHMANLVDKAAIDNLKYIDSLLNSNHGYTKIKRESEIRLVRDKKINYDDFQQAYESVASGYNLLAESPDKKPAIPAIQKAVEIWEAALKESNLSDKKARIDADVTIATVFNLIEATIWTDDYARSASLIAKLNTLDPSKKEKREAEELNDFLKLQKLRYEANR